ncbi:MAG TPA: ribosome silencing factor [Thermodesulfobacteriota bacterium]|nr:ribosome silencing factor [Thermodesulfobacteriota bacterium]
MVLARAAWDKKAQDTVVIDIKALSDFADYFIICSADSDRGVKTIVENIEEELEGMGERVLGVEGYADSRWVLIDAADVVVHVFYEPVRKFYDIEGLWADAPRVELPFEDGFSKQVSKVEEDYG